DEIHYKVFPFSVTSTKEMQTDKGRYGIIKGYASTFGNVDRGGDIVMQGAFSECLERYKSLGRPIRMHFQHNYMELIGGFPAEKAYED
ncbi:MAG: hypothetical protein GTN67_13350, partial [Hydrotalea flava]|nr:hypothetical protein [Hydrotalea flava]NIO95070.1 hypothetical protein [Hydrotalea flava]NIS93894.1 hypothetical protein [Hydrotalea flava]